MSILIFSTYVSEIKEVWNDTIANEDLINLLFGAITYKVDVRKSNGEVYEIDKTEAHRLMTNKSNVSPKIKKASDNKKVIESIYEYFKTSVLKNVSNGMDNKLLDKLKKCVTDDASIVATTKNRLLSFATIENLNAFLSELLLYTVKIPNKNPGKSTNSTPITLNGHTFIDAPLREITPPDDVSVEEMPYVTALEEAYSNAEKTTVTTSNLGKYQENFLRQRKNYYAAEAVRQGVQDIYIDKGHNQFAVLEDEMYEGVVEVLESTHNNGYDRLNKVMAQAAQVQLDRCWLAHDTDWLGVSQRKGVCHILVNDARIKGWVKDDE